MSIEHHAVSDVAYVCPQSQYSVAANFGRVLAPTLQHMVETGRLDTNGGASPGKCPDISRDRQWADDTGPCGSVPWHQTHNGSTGRAMSHKALSWG
jgi:hypothetical protein